VLGLVVAFKVEAELDDVFIGLKSSGMFLVDVVHRGHLLLQIKQANKLGDLRELRDKRGQGKAEPEEHHHMFNRVNNILDILSTLTNSRKDRENKIKQAFSCSNIFNINK
jgi:hypothetical protein